MRALGAGRARGRRVAPHEQEWGSTFPLVETFKQGQVSSNVISMNSGRPAFGGGGHLTHGRFDGVRGRK